MPRGDRSGPEGMGPMTGRGMGNCAGDAPGYGPGYGPGNAGRRRFGRFGMAFRHGRRRFQRPMWDFEPEFAPEDDKEWLQQEEKYLKKQLEVIQKRLQGTEESPE